MQEKGVNVPLPNTFSCSQWHSLNSCSCGHKLLREKVRLISTQTVAVQKTWLTAVLKCTYSSGKWSMWKLILWLSFKKWVHISTVQTSRSVPVTTYRKRSLCELMRFWWRICCAGCRYICDFFNPMRLGVRVCCSPPTTDSNVTEASDYWTVSQCPLLAEKTLW